jgi:histidinol-phosphatase (PHP family)
VTDRQARDLPLDAHVHTDLSSDSDVPIDEYARQAVERGIAELAITDHVDFRPGAPNYSFSTFEQRERQVREAAERWAPQGVAIRFGAELTYERDFDDDIRAHIRRHAYDFIIGSVHIGADSPFTPARVAGWVAGRSLAEIVEPYYIEVEAAARSGLFDTLGHIDFVKRFLAPHVTATDLATAPELLDPILRALVDSGTALEINTSGLRQPPGESYPSPATVARFRELGGERITIGTDAHRAEHFAFALADGYDYAGAAGFESLWFRRGAERAVVPLGATMPGADGS